MNWGRGMQMRAAAPKFICINPSRSGFSGLFGAGSGPYYQADLYPAIL